MAEAPGLARAPDTLAPEAEKVPAIPLFLAFASAYFLSALIRAITATLAPTLVDEFTLSASDLGLLSGGYFFGFSMTQLPLGAWLDRFGPKRVLLAFLMVAVTGCLCFAAADSFWTLCAARVACGVGLSACLMAPLTAYRRWYRPDNQQRASSRQTSRWRPRAFLAKRAQKRELSAAVEPPIVVPLRNHVAGLT